MPYIGRSSNFGVRTRFLYTATASQTTFSGTDTQNLTLSYSDSNFIDVHQNGVLLKVVDDYTATSGTSVVLATGATASDVIEITVYDVFSIANHIKKTGDAMAGALTNIDIDGTELVLDADGDTSIQASTDDIIVFDTGGSERARLDGSGNFFVSATATSGFQSSSSESGSIIYGAGGIASNSASNDVPAVFNRLGNDGSIIQLKKDGSTVGNVGNSGGALFISAASTGGLKYTYLDGSSAVTQPCNTSGTVTDGTHDLGSSGARFRNLYLGGGLYVGGTGSANYLDDYEEGTWTPAMNSGGSTLGIIADTAIYTKIGRFVHVQVYATSLASTTSSGFRISGLPYTNLSTGQTVGSIMYQNIDIPGSRTQMVAYAPSSSDIIRLYGVGDNISWQEITGTNTGTSFNMIINLQYTT